MKKAALILGLIAGILMLVSGISGFTRVFIAYLSGSPLLIIAVIMPSLLVVGGILALLARPGTELEQTQEQRLA